MTTPTTRKATGRPMTPVARKVAAKFKPDTRVVRTDGTSIDPTTVRKGTLEGTVVRHVPTTNAQGGTIVVAWDNGTTGRHSAGSLALVPLPVKITESQHRLLASIRDHDGDVWEGWRIWAAGLRKVNPGGAESAFGAVMRKGLAEHDGVRGSNTYRLTDIGQKALDAYEKNPVR